jgi:hypothetical protein
MPGQSHWLETAAGLVEPLIEAGPDQPICLLIGAGASLSSGGPRTSEVVEALMRLRPDLFPDEDTVYRKGHTISQDEREGAIGNLLKGIVPHIGYRCLAAMARTRPVIVIDLNWDDSIPKACEKVGLPTDCHEEVDLDSVEEVAAAWSRLRKRGYGLLAVHPHGLFRRGNMRFATNHTLTIKGQKLALLQELMSERTIVIGTSLTGPLDVTDLVAAMSPLADTPGSERRFLWVLEHGPSAREPDRRTQAGDDLRKALAERDSAENYIADEEVDFDLLMTTLRAREVGLTWNQLAEHDVDNVDLPDLTKLVLPNPEVTRPLLDTDNVLLTGRAQVGKSVIAHLVAHWHALLAPTTPDLRTVTGRKNALDTLRELEAASPQQGATVVVCDRCLGADVEVESATQLAQLVRHSKSRIVMSSAPQPLLSVLDECESLGETTNLTVLDATRTWTGEGLRRYARRLAGDRSDVAANLVGRIDREELQTPLQVSLAFRKASPPYADEQVERGQLTEHVEGLCHRKENEAVLLALLRFQDMSHPRPMSDLARLTGADIERVAKDPWDLVKTFQMDTEYLRLSDSATVAAVDQCIVRHHDHLRRAIEGRGEPLRWALEAFEEWDTLHATPRTAAGVAKLDDCQRERFGPQLVREAIEVNAEQALEVLEALRKGAHDEWALKDIALILAEHWERLEDDPEAFALRDRFLGDDKRNGTYAIFEGLLRRGGWAPPTLWSPVVARVLDMAHRGGSVEDERAHRRQVALCFDALLWRTAPAHESQHTMLLGQLLKAASKDPLLKSMFAVSVAYHHNHAKQLGEIGLPDPLEEIGGEATEEQATEMAWVVAWHFIHQSRNRAVASRRFFNSTRLSAPQGSRQILLNRGHRETPLPADWAAAVCKVATIIGRCRGTAGWGLHLVMNIHATSGRFHFDDLEEIRENTDPEDPGLISATITYKPTPEVRAVIRDHISSPEGRSALLAGLGEGVRVEEVCVLSPRFLLTHEEWSGLRERWNIDDEYIWAYFKIAPAKTAMDRWHVLGILRDAMPAAEELASPDSVRRVVDLFERGDTRPFLEVTTNPPSQVGHMRPTPGDPVWALAAAAIWLELNAPEEDS